MMTDTFSAMQDWGKGILAGEQVVLRTLQSDDLPTLSAWWNDTAEGIFQQDRLVQRPTQPIESMFEMWSANDSAGGCGYSIEVNGALVGHLTLWGLTMPTRIATFAIMIGPPFQGKGFGRDAIQVALRLAFEEMGANKVELTTWAYNERAAHVYKTVGFVEEGRRRAATFHRGTFYDQLQFGLLASEYNPKAHQQLSA